MVTAMEDTLQQRLQQHHKEWFTTERRRQHVRHRQRVREIHSVARESQQHVAAAAAKVRATLSGNDTGA